MGAKAQDLGSRSMPCDKPSLSNSPNNRLYMRHIQSLKRQKVAGIITTDMKGAIDRILRNRLLFRFRSQGKPENILVRVNSFMSERSANIQLDQIKTKPIPILCGLPQELPISPILFLLYIEPLLRPSRGRFSYVDDTAIFDKG